MYVLRWAGGEYFTYSVLKHWEESLSRYTHTDEYKYYSHSILNKADQSMGNFILYIINVNAFTIYWFDLLMILSDLWYRLYWYVAVCILLLKCSGWFLLFSFLTMLCLVLFFIHVCMHLSTSLFTAVFMCICLSKWWNDSTYIQVCIDYRFVMVVHSPLLLPVIVVRCKILSKFWVEVIMLNCFIASCKSVSKCTRVI